MLVELSGDVDIAVKDELRATLEQAAAQDKDVDIDVSRVDYADSTALGLFCALRTNLMAKGGRVCLISPTPRLRKLLSYAGLDQAFDIIERA